MELTRLFTDTHGLTKLETVEVPMTPEDELGHLTATFPATEAVFCEVDSNFQQSWHTAPRRQLVIVLSGNMEITLHNGSTTRIGVGQVLLAEDAGGDGHKTRAIGNTPLRITIIPLA